eukprot:TRINITY_DN23638_c0_g1_i1.p1 TRINITY_DN23638_c0_g1~~TRINITY_DN23638_c0_g1_i1.p1  ORF type:complete len:567 (-),score=128.39 TRINITY_DN23638_c0_g1_i1:25-1539(-)
MLDSPGLQTSVALAAAAGFSLYHRMRQWKSSTTQEELLVQHQTFFAEVERASERSRSQGSTERRRGDVPMSAAEKPLPTVACSHVVAKPSGARPTAARATAASASRVVTTQTGEQAQAPASSSKKKKAKKRAKEEEEDIVEVEDDVEADMVEDLEDFLRHSRLRDTIKKAASDVRDGHRKQEERAQQQEERRVRKIEEEEEKRRQELEEKAKAKALPEIIGLPPPPPGVRVTTKEVPQAHGGGRGGGHLPRGDHQPESHRGRGGGRGKSGGRKGFGGPLGGGRGDALRSAPNVGGHARQDWQGEGRGVAGRGHGANAWNGTGGWFGAPVGSAAVGSGNVTGSQHWSIEEVSSSSPDAVGADWSHDAWSGGNFHGGFGGDGVGDGSGGDRGASWWDGWQGDNVWWDDAQDVRGVVDSGDAWWTADGDKFGGGKRGRGGTGKGSRDRGRGSSHGGRGLGRGASVGGGPRRHSSKDEAEDGDGKAPTQTRWVLKETSCDAESSALKE